MTICAGAVLRHARSTASFAVARSTFGRLIMVKPLAPHAPGAGENAAGCVAMNVFCCSGVSLTQARAEFGEGDVGVGWLAERERAGSRTLGSVAKILFRTRKSGCSM